MDENKLRNLEKQYKLRVKTGCGTCRIRRIKCDETRPACLRCTKTGRTCDGYAHLTKTSRDGYGAAAYRNPSFLVVPQKTAIVRSPSRHLSQNPKENRSFEYFQTRTLPMWTEFFNSELWSRTVLQLSHDAPAIKHGILALSTMHERFEGVVPISTADSRDFAFNQYMLAVRHSNQLLNAFQEGKSSLAMVLTACIIFTCYENLAGNYGIAKMHLRNGLRILDQYRSEEGIRRDANVDAIAQSMYRFDVEAMTFSDDAAPYEYNLAYAPVCPMIADRYTGNEAARDDLVGLLRCMMWLSGVTDRIPTAPQHMTWICLHRDMSSAIKKWEMTFARYQEHTSPQHRADARKYAGDTLLRMGALMVRVVAGAGGGNGSEMAWDAFVDSFRTIVDLADTLPILRAPAHSTSSSSYRTTQPREPRRIAPNPAYTPSPQPITSLTFVFRTNPNPIPCSPQPSTPTPSNHISSFSPSFELSPIVPLFLTACRCRDPLVRRRAITHLLRFRRREGVWDSLGAGLAALQWMLQEENFTPSPNAPINFDNAFQYLALNTNVQKAADVREEARVKDVFVRTEVLKGRVGLVFELTGGGRKGAEQRFWENR